MRDLLVCQSLSRKNRRAIWMQLTPSPIATKIDKGIGFDPIRPVLGLVDAAITRPAAVASVASTFTLTILRLCLREKITVDRRTPTAGGNAIINGANDPDGTRLDDKVEF